MADNQIYGKSPLQNILGLKSLKRNVRRWFTTELPNLVSDIMSAYQKRNEVLDGGIVTDGTATATEMMGNVTALNCVLNGRRMAELAAISDDDLLDDATTGVTQPIYEDGTDASALSLGTDEDAYVTLIVCNTDAAAGAVETDNAAPLLLAIVAGTAATYASQTEHLSSLKIQEALEASAGESVDHSGVTGWAHVAQIVYSDTGGAAWALTPTMNRNNVISEA